MLQKFAAVTVAAAALLLAREGIYSTNPRNERWMRKSFLVLYHYAVVCQQCFTVPDCIQDSFPSPSARECCVGTEDGRSYQDIDGTCTVKQCIGEFYHFHCMHVHGKDVQQLL